MNVQAIIGQTIYFGEVLGKHSDIYGKLQEHHLTKVTDSQYIVELFETHDLSSGYNPLNYCDNEEDWDDDNEEEDNDNF